MQDLFLRQKNIDTLSQEEAKAEIQSLSNEINYHDNLYYGKSQPSVADSTYDELRIRLKKIEEKFPQFTLKNSPSFKVSGTISKGFKKVRHTIPMLSLDNAFSMEDMMEFYARIRRFLKLDESATIELVAEPKIDGLCASLHYENGFFVRGITRGNGQEGEDITANIKEISSIPKKLSGSFIPKNVEIRGEVYMTHVDFEKLNTLRQKKKETLFSNPRNAASGSLRQLDSFITKSRHLRFFAYTVLPDSTLRFKTYEKQRDWIRDAGFKTLPEHKKIISLEELDLYYKNLEIKRANLPFDIDGVVYKMNVLSLQERLGSSSRAPRWAIAQKFPAKKAVTILKDIKIQVGRTGVLTPVAHLKPITVGGVVVKRATLHNEDELQRKDIRPGDTVIIQRAGDVIPQVIEALKEHRPLTSLPFTFPKKCPACGSHVARKDGYAAWYCTGGLICPAQARERLCHFVSLGAFNIDGLGRKNIKMLFEKRYITAPQDIFTLQERNGIEFPLLEKNDGWGDLSVKNLFLAINKARTIVLSRFLFALGIPMIGKVTAKAIAEHTKSYEKFKIFTEKLRKKSSEAYEEFLSLDGIGLSVLDNLVDFITEPHNQEVLQALEKQVLIQDESINFHKANTPFTNKKIVFTGTLQHMTRQEAKQKAEAQGAKIQSSISAKTDYLIVGDKPGSKEKKAKMLNISILTEEKWLELLESSI